MYCCEYRGQLMDRDLNAPQFGAVVVPMKETTPVWGLRRVPPEVTPVESV